ncbi:MAG: hypothetical protein CMI01_14590 [Oceanospirillaceae bacterium]|nr:hypothetical protein [Oceanospirillaceae bacterium]
MPDEPLIKSRPTYTEVSLRPNAQKHLFVSTAQSLSKIRSLYDEAPKGEKALYLFGKPEVTGLGTECGSLSELEVVINALPLASAVYVAGDEGFLWDVHNLAEKAGLASEQIQLLAPESNKRRLFCTHCYAITEEVTYSPHACSGCGRLLLVRDHYSKLHGAYVGVQINAEDPADIPETEELV